MKASTRNGLQSLKSSSATSIINNVGKYPSINASTLLVPFATPGMPGRIEANLSERDATKKPAGSRQSGIAKASGHSDIDARFARLSVKDQAGQQRQQPPPAPLPTRGPAHQEGTKNTAHASIPSSAPSTSKQVHPFFKRFQHPSPMYLETRTHTQAPSLSTMDNPTRAFSTTVSMRSEYAVRMSVDVIPPPVVDACFITVEESDTLTLVDNEEPVVEEGEDVIEGDRPIYSYNEYLIPGCVQSPARVYVANREEAEELVQGLKGPLGFDMEWKVIFRRGARERKTALIQLADKNMILLMHVHKMGGVPGKLKELIEDENILKVGINIGGDGRKLFRDWGIKARGFVEISRLAKLVDPDVDKSKRLLSLPKVVDRYLGCELLKDSARTSDWELDLDEQQLEYAANDVHSGLAVYKELMGRAEALEKTIPIADITVDLEAEATGVIIDKAKADKMKAKVPVGTNATDAIMDSELLDAEEDWVDSFGRPASPPVKTAKGSLRPVSGVSASASTSTSSLVSTAGSSSSKGPRSETAAQQDKKTESKQRRTPYLRDVPTPQQLRAYRLWYVDELPLDAMCARLRTQENPLKHSTVISYVVEALRKDGTLRFDKEKLVEFIKSETGSWRRHRDWVKGLA